MDLDQPVDENTAHTVSDLGLVVHVLGLWLVDCFFRHVVLHNICAELRHILRVFVVVTVAVLNCFLKVLVHTALELLVCPLDSFLKLLSRVHQVDLLPEHTLLLLEQFFALVVC